RTFPEYERLRLDSSGRKAPLNIAIIVAPDESMDRPNDLGRKTFDTIVKFFKDWRWRGRRLLESREDHSLSKLYSLTNDEGEANIRVLFANPDSDDFPEQAARLLQDASVFM